MQPEPRQPGDPTLAVVICTRNREASLRATLASIWAQSRRPDELVVIDDGDMSDALVEDIRSRCDALDVAFQYQRSARPGLTRSRNRAADIAASDVLIYLDDDVACHREFVAEMGALFRDACIGAVTATVEEPTFSSRSAQAYLLGYRLAGWWQIAPRHRPPGRPPAVLRNPDVAVPARWLSGAAMAIRRDLVQRFRFDEDLVEYALGEDREMGYRLAPHTWIIASRRARVVHRREPSQRLNARRLGFMTAYNYIRIIKKTCRPGPGQWMVVGWNLLVLAMMHLAWAAVGHRRAHLNELCGMFDGVAVAFSRRSAPSLRRKPLDAASRIGSVLRRMLSMGVRTPPAQIVRDAPRPRQKQRRVLFMTNRLEHGGAERMLAALAQHLPALGVTPLVGCLKDAGPLAEPCRAAGIAVFDRLLHHKTDAAAVLRIRRLIREERVDVVVVAHSGGDRMFWSTLAAALTDTPVVVWSHWCPLQGEPHIERANRALYRWVDAFVALGEYQRLALIRYEHVPAGRITVIPNAIELEPFINAAPRAEARRRLGLEDHHIAVAIVANLRTEKRHDIFIEAARVLAPEHPKLRFFVVGDGPNRDAVQAAAAASRLDHDTLRLLGARDDVPDLLAAMDMACLCSELECFSVTMLEAAAVGCPFIGPDTGCLTDFLRHEQTGLVIKPADLPGLADAITRLADDVPLRRRLGETARQVVLREYGINAMARPFSDLFAGLVRQRRFGPVPSHDDARPTADAREEAAVTC